MIIDVPFEEWINYNKTNFYITENRIVHNNFYKLSCAGDMGDLGIRMSEKECIVQLKYDFYIILILKQLSKLLNY